MIICSWPILLMIQVLLVAGPVPPQLILPIYHKRTEDLCVEKPVRISLVSNVMAYHVIVKGSKTLRQKGVPGVIGKLMYQKRCTFIDSPHCVEGVMLNASMYEV